MSIIIDCPSSDKLGVPHLGEEDTFGSPLHQVIVGAKVHGELYFCSF
jgi:hypothetical protein